MRTLVVGDVHEPVSHPGYLKFCQDLRDQWKCDDVIFIGDLVDWHAVSFHAAHPQCPGPNDEYELAFEKIAKWCKAFPKAKVCIGNHDERIVRLAATSGIPARLIRDYQDSWDTPGWDWQYEHNQEDIHYFHGTGNGGKYPASNAVTKMLMSCVMGHIHTAAGVKWFANPAKRLFGMDTGCGIDDRAFQFAYGRHMKQRSVLAAGVVIDGIPYSEIMPIGPGEDYHRSKFSKKGGKK